MKFMLSEGRTVCLMEKSDASDVVSGKIPNIDLLLVPAHYRTHIEKSHTWKEVLPKVRNGLRNVVYF